MMMIFDDAGARTPYEGKMMMMMVLNGAGGRVSHYGKMINVYIKIFMVKSNVDN